MNAKNLNLYIMKSKKPNRKEAFKVKKLASIVPEWSRLNSIHHQIAQQNSPKKNVSILRSFTGFPSTTHSFTLLKSKELHQSKMEKDDKKLGLLEKITPKKKKVPREEPPEDILNSRYQIEATLSKSEFSIVYRARCQDDGMPVAIKMVTPPGRADQELQILKNLKNEKTSIYRTDFLYGNYRCIVLEYCERNPLFMLNTKKVAYSLIKAIGKIHKSGIIHSNLCIKNLLFFGSSLRLIDYSQAFTLCSKGVSHQFHKYRAPELILDCPYNTGIDLWCYGCILAELVIGKPLFEGNNDHELLISIMKLLGKPPLKFIRQSAKLELYFEETEEGLLIPRTEEKIPYSNKLHCIDKLKQCPLALGLLKLCFEWNPVHRVTADQAIRHPYFSNKRSASRKPTQFRRLTKQYTMATINNC